MHKPVRRKDREISINDARDLMRNSPYGVLATASDDGQPYTTPLSYVFDGDYIYFHCALEGHKLDNIRTNPAVSFCVVGQTKTLPKMFATEYESAVAFGTAKEIHGDEKQDALLNILEKYSPEFIPQGIKYIAGKIDETTVIKIDVKHLTGKARR